MLVMRLDLKFLSRVRHRQGGKARRQGSGVSYRNRSAELPLKAVSDTSVSRFLEASLKLSISVHFG